MDTTKVDTIIFKNSTRCQQKIRTNKDLMYALKLLIEHGHAGYLMKENKKFHICVWDKPLTTPHSIYPLYKGTFLVGNNDSTDSQEMFSITEDTLNAMPTYLYNQHTTRSHLLDVVMNEDIKDILKTLEKIDLLIQL